MLRARSMCKEIYKIAWNSTDQWIWRGVFKGEVFEGCQTGVKWSLQTYLLVLLDVVIVLPVSLRDWLRIAWQSALFLSQSPDDPVLTSLTWSLSCVFLMDRGAGGGAGASTFSDGKFFFFFYFGYPDLSLTTQTRFCNLTLVNTEPLTNREQTNFGL